MNLDKLSTAELRLVKDALFGILLGYPQMKNIESLLDEIKKRLDADPDRKEGERLLKIAEEHGLEEGYARPEDYYFFVKEEDIGGKKHIELLLCLKYEWYLNGRTYDHNKSKSIQCRNFSYFFQPPFGHLYEEYWSGYEFGKSTELRAALLKAGLEEKPELERFYDELCEEHEKARQKRQELD
jgi:hypothetical protein